MARNPSISISFSRGKTAQEINALVADLKNLRKEFEVSNTAIEASGDKLALAQNKLKQFGEEAKILRNITAAMQRGLEDATNTQAKLAARVEAARQAYEKAARSENTSKEQVERLKKEYEDLSQRLAKADKAVANWRNKLQDAQIAENKLKIAVNQTNKEIEEQNKKHVETARNTEKVTTATGQLINVYTLLKGLILGYTGKTLFEALIGSNAQFEQYMATFEVLLGSAEKAQKRMDELTEFAAKTPFELPQVVEAEKRLLSYGIAAEDTAKMLQVLGDLSMGNAQKLNSLTLAYGQVVTATRLTGGELRQFSEAGIPLLDELAKMYNTTTAEMREMVSEGQISAEAVTVALQRLTSEGGKFHGMMEKQSQTMEGMWATLKDNISMFVRDVGEQSFKQLKYALSDFIDELNNLEQSGKLGDIAAEWGRNIAKFVEFIVGAIKILWDMKEALVAAGIAFAAFKTSMAIGSAILAVVNAIESYTAAVKAGTTATAALTTVLNTNPWILLASAIAAVIAGIAGYNLIVKDATNETNELRDSIKSIVEETERATKSARDNANATIAQIERAEELIPELEELSNKTNRTKEENDRLNYIINQLNNAMPNLALAIDNETGALNRQIPVIYATVDAYKKLAEAKGIEAEIEAYTQSKVRLQEEAQEAYKRAFGKQILSSQEIEKIKQGITESGSYFAAPGSKTPTVLDWESLKTYNEIAQRIIQINQNIADSEKRLQEIYAERAELSDEVKKILEGNLEPPPLEDLETKTREKEKEREKARQEAIKKEFQDLKFALDMGYITEAEYYRKLAELRDKYFEVGSSEWQQYTLQIKQYNDRLKEDAIRAEREKYEERRRYSDQWISEQKYYSKLTADEEIAAYERIRAYVKEYYTQGIIDQKEYYEQMRELNRKIFDVEREKYNERRKYSDQWIADQKFYGKLSIDEEIAAYERIKQYVKEYYAEGIISQKEYYAELRELDKNIYAARKQALEEEIKNTVEAQKKILDARKKAIEEEAKAEKKAYDERRKAIEEYYDMIDRAERQQERSTRLSELYRLEQIYQNAVTLEGKNKLKEIREEIAKLNKEAEKEQRELEKKSRLEALEREYEQAEEERARRLEAINKEYENLDNKQKILLENIASYAALSAGALEEITNRIRNMINAISNPDLSNFNKTAAQAIYNIYQTNNNNIADPVNAAIFGAYLTTGFMRFISGVR